MSTIYMALTKDEYELPYAVADSMVELAEIIGTRPNNISCALSRVKRGDWKKCFYAKVEVDDDE